MATKAINKAPKQIAAANQVASMATLAAALDKNQGLADAMTALADAAETTAMGSLVVYRMLTDTENGGLTDEQLAALPTPDTQGWDAQNPTIDGDYSGYSGNNPDWFKRPSLVPGVNKPAITSAINLFSDGLLVCRQWAEVIAQAEKDMNAGLIDKDDFTGIQDKFQGRIDRMRTKVRGSIKLGQNLAAAGEEPWSEVLTVGFYQRKEFKKDKDGKFARDKAGRPIYTLIDENTTTPIVISALDAEGKVTAKHFRTIEQFNALDFVAALEDTKDAPGGTLQALFATAQRTGTGGKDNVTIANVNQIQSAIYGLAGILPDNLPAIGKVLDKHDQTAMEYMDALTDVRNNVSALLNVPARQKAYLAYCNARSAKAEAEAEAKAKAEADANKAA
jgi:hypothetical protein